MGRTTKEYLSYYPWECNAFEVDKGLKLLCRKYGPLGETIYRRTLDLIYSNGYYIEASVDDLAMMIVDKIGSKWVSDSKCAEVLLHCSEIGLFNDDLVRSEIWTSVGIQNRYFSIMKLMKRKIDAASKKYLLIDIPLNTQFSQKTSEDMPISSEEKTITSEVMPMKRKERNNDKDDIRSIFDLFENSFARPMTQIELQKISDWLNVFAPTMIKYALTLAVSANAINLRYIEKIINNWRTNHITTVEEAELFSASIKSKKTSSPARTPRRVAEMPKYMQESTPSEKMSKEELADLIKSLERLEE